MPEHGAPVCRASIEPGYAHQLPDGRLHCNRCGWTTPTPVVCTRSEETGNVYLTWEEYVAAETNGYVVVVTTSRPNTAPAVWGPYPTGDDARRARARHRRAVQRQEEREHGPGHKISTCIRVLNRA
jgi:hypothetical protein